MTPLALPDDWTEDEAALVRALVTSGTHSLVVDFEFLRNGDIALSLLTNGWLTMWQGEDSRTLVTFTPRGAAALGLTLDGDPARWMTVAESRALEPPKARSGRVVLETDLHAARSRAGLASRPVGDDAENRRIGQGDGWRARQDGGLAAPTFLLTEGPRGMDDWIGPVPALSPTCPICVPRGGLRTGEYCLRCDRSWQDRAKAARGRRAG